MTLRLLLAVLMLSGAALAFADGPKAPAEGKKDVKAPKMIQMLSADEAAKAPEKKDAKTRK